jgi:hypothetical protein
MKAWMSVLPVWIISCLLISDVLIWILLRVGWRMARRLQLIMVSLCVLFLGVYSTWLPVYLA